MRCWRRRGSIIRRRRRRERTADLRFTNGPIIRGLLENHGGLLEDECTSYHGRRSGAELHSSAEVQRRSGRRFSGSLDGAAASVYAWGFSDGCGAGWRNGGEAQASVWVSAPES